jgi:hypothetical protein
LYLEKYDKINIKQNLFITVYYIVMNPKIILLIVALVVLVLLALFGKKIVHYFRGGKSSSTVLYKPVSGKTETKVARANMPKLEKGLGMKQTITFWLWLNDLSYREKNFKEILRKSNNNLSIGIGPRNGDNMRQQFNDGFRPSENKLFVNVRNNSTIQSLEFNDFPIQKWLHFVIILDNRNVDVFMNGELKKSMVLESPPKLEEDAELIFNANGGFDGKVSNAKVFNYGVCHAEIVKLIQQGPITLGIVDRIKAIFSSAGDKLANVSVKCPIQEKKDAEAEAEAQPEAFMNFRL